MPGPPPVALAAERLLSAAVGDGAETRSLARKQFECSDSVHADVATKEFPQSTPVRALTEDPVELRLTVAQISASGRESRPKQKVGRWLALSRGSEGHASAVDGTAVSSVWCPPRCEQRVWHRTSGLVAASGSASICARCSRPRPRLFGTSARPACRSVGPSRFGRVSPPRFQAV